MNSNPILDELDSSEREITDYQKELLEITGFISEEGAIEQFGITSEEYKNPTEDTIDKVKQVLFLKGSTNTFKIDTNGEIVRKQRN